MICVDLDCTLIDSERRYADEREIAQKYGIDEKEYRELVNELCFNRGVFAYTFELVYEFLLRRRPGLSPKIVDDLRGLLDKNYLFPDSSFFLDAFGPKDLAIVATGKTHFQWRKLSANGLYGKAHLVWVTEHKNKAGAVAGIVVSNARVNHRGKVFFIDDAPREIEVVKKAHPKVICIQVRTPASWETQHETDYYDVHLPNLEAVTHYIKGILAASA